MRTNLLKKKMLLVLFALFSFGYIAAAVEVTTTTAGTLAAELTTVLGGSTDFSVVTDLEISGPINDVDFATMRNMSALANLDLSDAIIATIPNEALQRKSSLISIVLPASITQIGNSAFRECRNLATIDFSATTTSLTEIGNDAFRECAIVNLNLGGTGLINLQNNIFLGSSLQHLILPATINEIWGEAFQEAKNIVSVSFSSSNPKYTLDTNGILYTTDMKKVVYCPAKIPATATTTTITIPAGVEEICNNAFNHNTTIEEVILPASLKRIGNNAFRGSTSLTEVDFSASTTSLTVIDNESFRECGVEELDLSNTGIVKVQNNLFFGSALKTLILPDTVDEFWGDAFQEAKNIESVSFSPSNFRFALAGGIIYTADMHNMIYCPAKVPATEITIPEGVEYIRNNAFNYNTIIEKVILPSSLKEIQNNVFRGCTSLAEVDFTATTAAFTTIGEHAFRGTTSLESCLLPSSITEIKHNAFNSSGIVTIDLSGTQITALNGSMFENTQALTSVLLPNTLKTINNNIFYNSSLATFEIPASVTTIHREIFNEAKNIASISVESGNEYFYSLDNTAIYSTDKANTSIGGDYDNYATANRMLYYAPKSPLTELKVPEGITSVAIGIRGNTTLTTVDLPSTLLNIQGEAFFNLNINTLICRAPNPPACSDGAFWDNGQLTEVCILASSITAYNTESTGFKGCFLNKFVGKVYVVGVTDGEAFPPYAIENEVVAIKAGAAPIAGEQFVSWESTDVTAIDGDTNNETTFTMPSNDVSITATFGVASGINDVQEEDGIIIYPNPTADFIQVKGLSENVSFNIINSLGQTVKNGSAYNGESIGVNDLPSGIYIFSAAGNTKTFIKK